MLSKVVKFAVKFSISSSSLLTLTGELPSQNGTNDQQEEMVGATCQSHQEMKQGHTAFYIMNLYTTDVF